MMTEENVLLTLGRRFRLPKVVVRSVNARPILQVYCLALCVRLLYNLTAAAAYRPVFDAALYDTIARNLINRHCYCLFGVHESVSRAPLWPGIMAAIYTVFGQDNLYPRLFLCALGAGTCVLVYRFARDLFGARTGLVAGVIAAIYTGLFLYDGWLYTEALYTFCATGFTYALYRVQRVQTGGQMRADKLVGARLLFGQRLGRTIARHRWEVICGLLIGAATLTRPNGLLLLGVVALWAAIAIRVQGRPAGATLRSIILIIVLAVAVVTPWTVRNFIAVGTFVSVETGLGEVLLGAYNDTVSVGGSGPLATWSPPEGALNHDDARYTPDMDREDTLRAIHWMTDHPAMMPILWALHLGQMWLPYTPSNGLPIEQDRQGVAAPVMWTLVYLEPIPIFVLAAIGLWLTRRYRGELVPVYLVIGSTVLLNVLLYSIIRFRAPIEPLLVILAAAGLTMIPWHQWAIRTRTT